MAKKPFAKNIKNQTHCSNIARAFERIQAYIPEQCRFITFEQSFSTVSRYMFLTADDGEVTRLLCIRLSDHRQLDRAYRQGLLKYIPTCSIALDTHFHPAKRCWVDAVIWLYAQTGVAIPRNVKKAIWKHYRAFKPKRYGERWPKSIVHYNSACPQSLMNEICAKYDDFSYIQKLIRSVPEINPETVKLLVSELDRRAKQFGAEVKKTKEGYKLFVQD